ncbi:MAG: histidine phosphatase family protein [Rhizobiales bacterium]|nr:histidine phosphatase family protein [Hyphomicrobiales bacterium]
MLRLMLLRHAKSDWPTGVDDHERPLGPRGRLISPRIGHYMAEEGLAPDLAIVSTARRAHETWELARPAFAQDIAVKDEPRIYEAAASAILGVARETGSGVYSLLLVGHNPGLQDLVLKLASHGRKPNLARLRRKFPTAALAVIDFDVDRWEAIGEGPGDLERFETPKSIGRWAGGE